MDRTRSRSYASTSASITRTVALRLQRVRDIDEVQLTPEPLVRRINDHLGAIAAGTRVQIASPFANIRGRRMKCAQRNPAIRRT
jgi:hypothetical protein